MAEQALISLAGQLGAASILAVAVVSLFNRLTALQAETRQYLINQNAALREENKMLLMTITQMIPGFAETYVQNKSGAITNLNP